jgi:hypothetical protein
MKDRSIVGALLIFAIRKNEKATTESLTAIAH